MAPARTAASADSSALVLGVDGGGTKTIARVLCRGPGGRLCVLGTGVSGASNPNGVGWDAAVAAIAAACRDAAGADDRSIDAAVLAVAGCGPAASQRRLEAAVAGVAIAQRVVAVPDSEPLLAHLPEHEPAVALISGTGSSALVRTAAGTTVVGGWGYLVGDDGSGFALGRHAVRHTATRLDAGHRADALAEAVLAHGHCHDAAGLKAALYAAESPRGWLAGLAPVVLRLAEGGDAAAAAIAERGASALSELAVTAARRVAAGDTTQPPIVLGGGLLERSASYRRSLTGRLIACGWAPGRIALAPDAASGCGLLALRALESQAGDTAPVA